LASRAAGQERNQRPQTFPASADGVGDVTFNGRVKGGRLFDDSLFDLIELRLD
jgi:hypothetical protein